MSEVLIILSTIVIIAAVIVLSVMARQALAPLRRDSYLISLFGSIAEADSANQMSQAPHTSVSVDDSLAESLLRHFEQSLTSRYVLMVLTSATNGMQESELLVAVNRQLSRLRKRKLPAAVVRKVAMILMGANLAALHQGKLKLTVAGRRLHALLQVRSEMQTGAPAFVSP